MLGLTPLSVVIACISVRKRSVLRVNVFHVSHHHCIVMCCYVLLLLCVVYLLQGRHGVAGANFH